MDNQLVFLENNKNFSFVYILIIIIILISFFVILFKTIYNHTNYNLNDTSINVSLDKSDDEMNDIIVHNQSNKIYYDEKLSI